MKDPICERCREPRSKHLWMGRGDIMADIFSAPALVCPTALFAEHEHAPEETAQWGASGALAMRACKCGAMSRKEDGEWTPWE